MHPPLAEILPTDYEGGNCPPPAPRIPLITHASSHYSVTPFGGCMCII